MARPPVDAFSEEVQFQVGQRVLVNFNAPGLKDAPGTIVGIRTRFPTTPHLRDIRYKVYFDYMIGTMVPFQALSVRTQAITVLGGEDAEES